MDSVIQAIPIRHCTRFIGCGDPLPPVPFDTFWVLDQFKQNPGRIDCDYRKLAAGQESACGISEEQ
jgi:hypothetical protein